MARGEHHRMHAHDRLQRHRLLIAREAARVISEHGIRDFGHAKRKAAQKLGIEGDKSLPSNREIDASLREHQRLFEADTQPRALHQRREAACRAMQFFERFQPRLVGPVLQGTADEHSPVHLHLFSDDVESFVRFLHEHAIPARQQSRRLRLDRDREADYPVFTLAAGDVHFDITVMPEGDLRQAPLDPLDERPTSRARLRDVRELLARPETDGSGDSGAPATFEAGTSPADVN